MFRVPSRIPRLYAVIYVLVLALSLIVCALYAGRYAGRQKEIPQSADRFGYLQMAQDIRRGSAPHDLPRFTANSPHARLLLEFFRSRGMPVDNDAFVGPPAYHYVAATDRIVCQYPPGVGSMLAIWPAGRAVFAWQVQALAVLLLGASAAFLQAMVRPEAERLLAAGMMALAGQFGILMLGATVSYSIDLLILPLLAAVGAGFLASRRSGKEAAALAMLAGAALGWGMVIRVAAGLFLPGLVALLWPRRFRAVPPLSAMLLGFVVAGVGPLLLHQEAMTGSLFHPTYTPADTGFSLGSIAENAGYYFAGEGSDGLWVFLAGAAAGIIGLFARRKRADLRPGTAIALWWLIPTGYFLIHPIHTPYYQLPTLFCCLAGLAMALWAASDVSAKSGRPALTLLAAAICGAAALVSASTLPDLAPENHFRMPEISLPEAFKDPKAWIVGDRLAGTLWYYHGIYGHPLRALDAPTRRAFYQWVNQRGEPLYLLDDSTLGKELQGEFVALGATFTQAGQFADAKVYRIEWAAGGPR